MERMQHWAEDHGALLDAGLAGLRAGLKLTSDQDKLWPPFEAAVRDAANLHMDEMKSMMESLQKMREMIALLGRELIMMQRGHRAMEMMHGRMGIMGGMGMMGREGGDPGRMERMGHGADDLEDNSDDE
jgi:hypothetical protein